MDQLRGNQTMSPTKVNSDEESVVLKKQIQLLEAEKWALMQQVSQLEEKVPSSQNAFSSYTS
jgi:hypothetical protein